MQSFKSGGCRWCCGPEDNARAEEQENICTAAGCAGGARHGCQILPSFPAVGGIFWGFFGFPNKFKWEFKWCFLSDISFKKIIISRRYTRALTASPGVFQGNRRWLQWVQAVLSTSQGFLPAVPGLQESRGCLAGCSCVLFVSSKWCELSNSPRLRWRPCCGFWNSFQKVKAAVPALDTPVWKLLQPLEARAALGSTRCFLAEIPRGCFRAQDSVCEKIKL